MDMFYIWFSIFSVIFAFYTIAILLTADYSTHFCSLTPQEYHFPKITVRTIWFIIALIVDISIKTAIFFPTVVFGLILAVEIVAYFGDKNSENFL